MTAEEWAEILDKSLCEHKEWVGIIEVDAICANCGIDEMGLHFARKTYADIIKQIQDESFNEGIKFERKNLGLPTWTYNDPDR